MLLPVLDHIVNKFSSDVFFRDLKYKIEKDLNVRIHYSSVEDPVNDSSEITKYFTFFKWCVEGINTSPTL